LYSHDHQHVIIPDGTVVLAKRRNRSRGFGQQRRMAVAFHRLIMPDGYSVDLDSSTASTRSVKKAERQSQQPLPRNLRHSIALGVIAGAGEITQGGGTLPQRFASVHNGTAASVSQSATSILDRFLQIPPTITIREGHA